MFDPFFLNWTACGLDQRSARDLELLFPKLEAPSFWALPPSLSIFCGFPNLSSGSFGQKSTHRVCSLLECLPPFVEPAPILRSYLWLSRISLLCWLSGAFCSLLVRKFVVDRIHVSHTGSGTPRSKDRSEIVLATSHLRKWEICGYVIPEKQSVHFSELKIVCVYLKYVT